MAELPAPLPPEARTVGQVIAESVRAYGQHFWRAVPLGLPLLLADQVSAGHRSAGVQLLVFWAATPLFAAAYVWACTIMLDCRPTWTAFLLAVAIWLPFVVLRAIYVLPGVAWLAFIGLAVPAAMVERLDYRAALRRGRQLGRADYGHALGSLAALVVVVGVSEEVLSVLLHSQSGNAYRTALGISDVVLTPLLYLGGALLYLDQAARVGSPRPTKRSR